MYASLPLRVCWESYRGGTGIATAVLKPYKKNEARKYSLESGLRAGNGVCVIMC